MNNKIKLTMLTLGVALLMVSCEFNDYVDSHQIRGSELHLISEGKIFDLSLDFFEVAERVSVSNDTIFLEDEVKTLNTGFTAVECLDVISVRQYGNYQIRRCLYKTSFEVMISFLGTNQRFTYLPFTFKAEEVWLNGQRIMEQPFVFEKTETIITEFSPEDSEVEIFGKYLLDFQITAHNRYYEFAHQPFSLEYKVVRLKESNLYVSGDDISISVTYDWHP